MRVKALSRLYARNSGPLFGAQSTSDSQGFPGLNWRPAQPSGYGRGPGELSGSPEGWPSTSIPSLEERLDDHQPTRAWEHREEPSRKG